MRYPSVLVWDAAYPATPKPSAVAEEYPISRYVVDAQVLPIFEGVKPILELKVIGRSLLAG